MLLCEIFSNFDQSNMRKLKKKSSKKVFEPLIVGSSFESRVLRTELVSTNDLIGIHLALENY